MNRFLVTHTEGFAWLETIEEVIDFVDYEIADMDVDILDILEIPHVEDISDMVYDAIELGNDEKYHFARIIDINAYSCVKLAKETPSDEIVHMIALLLNENEDNIEVISEEEYYRNTK